jgi:hypothetical protein
MQSLESAESEIFLNGCDLRGRSGFESGGKCGMFCVWASFSRKEDPIDLPSFNWKIEAAGSGHEAKQNCENEVDAWRAGGSCTHRRRDDPERLRRIR